MTLPISIDSLLHGKDRTYFMCRLPIHPQAKPPQTISGSSDGGTPQVTREDTERLESRLESRLVASAR